MKNKIWLFSVIFIMILLIFAIVFNFTFGQKQEKAILIGYAKYSERWEQIRDGAQASSKRKGYDFESITCDSRSDVDKQIELIDEAISKEFDAIIIVPTDIFAIDDKLIEAQKKGAEVVVIGDLGEKYDYKYSGMDYYQAGQDMAKFIAENTEELSTVFCLVSKDGTKDATSAYDGFKEYAQSTDKISIATRMTIQTDISVAAVKVKEFLKKKNDIDYIITFEDDLTIGAGHGIYDSESANMLSDRSAKIIGIGASSDAIRLVDSGYVEYLIYENYYSIGYNAITCAFDPTRDACISNIVPVTKDNIFEKEIQKVIFPIDQH
jgi:ABC-type sugar transport system substrate-binding protein